MENNIQRIIAESATNIQKTDYKSFDLFDALTCTWINRLTSKSNLAQRIAIQINAKSPINLHWLGMNKMVHTKLVSDLLWMYSLQQNLDKAVPLYKTILDLKCEGTDRVWGLNFPYTNRFINADSNTPNLYNTATVGIALCEFFLLDKSNKKGNDIILQGIIDSIQNIFSFNDESVKGWFTYYPGQNSPTYNVNALAAYFLCKATITMGKEYAGLEIIQKLINLLIHEQNNDGSWYYSRSEKGNWIDGFHTGFIIESLIYVYSHGYKSIELEITIVKAIDYYIQNMFTKDDFPKYFSTSNKYPIEAQNSAQAIQTLSFIGLWFGQDHNKLLEKIISNTITYLYNPSGFFYHKKTKYITYKQSFLRWSTSPMLVALTYADSYLQKK